MKAGSRSNGCCIRDICLTRDGCYRRILDRGLVLLRARCGIDMLLVVEREKEVMEIDGSTEVEGMLLAAG